MSDFKPWLPSKSVTCVLQPLKLHLEGLVFLQKKKNVANPFSWERLPFLGLSGSTWPQLVWCPAVILASTNGFSLSLSRPDNQYEQLFIKSYKTRVNSLSSLSTIISSTLTFHDVDSMARPSSMDNMRLTPNSTKLPATSRTTGDLSPGIGTMKRHHSEPHILLYTNTIS